MEKKSEIRNPNILIFKEKISHKLFGHQMRPIVNVKLRLIINKPNDKFKAKQIMDTVKSKRNHPLKLF